MWEIWLSALSSVKLIEENVHILYLRCHVLCYLITVDSTLLLSCALTCGLHWTQAFTMFVSQHKLMLVDIPNCWFFFPCGYKFYIFETAGHIRIFSVWHVLSNLCWQSLQYSYAGNHSPVELCIDAVGSFPMYHFNCYFIQSGKHFVVRELFIYKNIFIFFSTLLKLLFGK